MQQATTHLTHASSLLAPNSERQRSVGTSASSNTLSSSPSPSPSASSSTSTSLGVTTSLKTPPPPHPPPPSSSSRPIRVIPGREWTESDTQLLFEGVKSCGEQWEVIASLFTPKRTILDCSKHYYAVTNSKRKQPTPNNGKTNNGSHTEFEFNPPLRRVRKTYSEIQRPFQCTEPHCPKAYGTEGALKMHKKLKHGINHTNTNSPSPPPAPADDRTAPHSPITPSPISQPSFQSLSPSPPACNTRTSSVADDTPTVISSSKEDGRRAKRPKFSSLLSPPPPSKPVFDSKSDPKMTFEIEKLSTGIELSAADGSYKISLSIQTAGAIILDIASSAETIRLVLSLNDTQIIARSLDACLLKPSPSQLQFVVSETPEILLRSPQDEEWRKLAIANVPTASKLDLIARSPIYEISMMFSNYVALMQMFTTDLLMKQKLQIVPTLLTSLTTPAMNNPISQRQLFPNQLQSASMPMQLGQGVPHQFMPYPVLQTQQLQNLSSFTSQLPTSQQQQLFVTNSMNYLSPRGGSSTSLSELLSNFTQPTSSNTSSQTSQQNFPPSY